MPNTSSAGRFGRHAACCCALAVLVLATAPARAQDDELSFEQRIIDSLLGRSSRPPIDYRERSPLVIPPSTELPPPESKTADAAPNWPRDPDVARRKSGAANGPVVDQFRIDSTPLSPSELRRGAKRQARSNEPVRTPSDGEMGRPLMPSDLGGKTLLGGLFSGSDSDKPVAFSGEPPRTSLLEPPSGYRTPAPTQPYAPPKDDRPWYKPFSWFDWGTERR